jgi:hypothetical protein
MATAALSPAPSTSSSSSGSFGHSPSSIGRLDARRRSGLHDLAHAASQSTPASQHSRRDGRIPQHRITTDRPNAESGRNSESPASSSSSSRKTSISITASVPFEDSSSSTQGATPSSSKGPTAKLGPLSQPVALPPRKQPGRKRTTEEPVDKRTAQNRTAQRAYRERRAQLEEEQRKRLTELETLTVPQLQARLAHYETQWRKDQEKIKLLEGELEKERTSTSGVGKFQIFTHFLLRR